MRVKTVRSDDSLNEVIWRTLIYQGQEFSKFEVSTDGKLRNIKTKNVYETYINHQGYKQVCVSLGSAERKKVFKIHKAVAETFIPNPNCNREVNHIDGNKLNNKVSNLEWVTGSENVRHAYDNGLAKAKQGVDNPWAKLTKEDVIYIREHYIPFDAEYGARALGRKFGVNKNTIRDVANNKSYINV